MIRKIQICLLACTAVFATGCPKYAPKVDFENPNTLVARINAHIASKRTLYDAALLETPSNTAKAKTIRNELIEDALPYIDGAYVDFITDIQQGRDRANFIADVVDLGTAGAVGITKGERTLQIIGVALTAFRGGRKAADANFYKDQSTPILISKMDGNRAKVRGTIIEREKKEVTDYQLGAAIADIVDYYNAGTLVRAFTQLQQDTAAITQQSEKELKDLKEKAGVLGAVSPEMLKVNKANSEAITVLVNAYRDANKKVTDADPKINAATQAITDATNAMTEADQNIGAAQQRIDAATAKPTPNATEKAKVNAEKAQAEGDKSKAEGDKAKAEAKKTKAEADKTAAENAKAEAIKARDTAFANLKATYDAIEGDPKLSPLLNQIPDHEGYDAAFKTQLRDMLQRLKENKPVETDADRQTRVRDYATILPKVSGEVEKNLAKEPTLNERLQQILKINK